MRVGKAKSLKEGGIGEVGKANGETGILGKIHNISKEKANYKIITKRMTNPSLSKNLTNGFR